MPFGNPSCRGLAPPHRLVFGVEAVFGWRGPGGLLFATCPRIQPPNLTAKRKPKRSQKKRLPCPEKTLESTARIRCGRVCAQRTHGAHYWGEDTGSHLNTTHHPNPHMHGPAKLRENDAFGAGHSKKFSRLACLAMGMIATLGQAPFDRGVGCAGGRTQGCTLAGDEEGGDGDDGRGDGLQMGASMGAQGCSPFRGITSTKSSLHSDGPSMVAGTRYPILVHIPGLCMCSTLVML